MTFSSDYGLALHSLRFLQKHCISDLVCFYFSLTRQAFVFSLLRNHKIYKRWLRLFQCKRSNSLRDYFALHIHSPWPMENEAQGSGILPFGARSLQQGQGWDRNSHLLVHSIIFLGSVHCDQFLTHVSFISQNGCILRATSTTASPTAPWYSYYFAKVYKKYARMC